MVDNLKKGPIPQFIDKVSKNWGLSFIFTKLWAVTFEKPTLSLNQNSGTLGANIENILKKYSDTNKFLNFINNTNNIYRDLLSTSDAISVDIANYKHFILANKVSIPNESVFIGGTNIPSQEFSAGFIWGRIAGSRENNVSRTVDITFLDTNKELVDLVIKPWIIASSHRGLIESTELPTLKCDISVYLFAKSGPNAQVNKKDKITVISNYPQYNKVQSLNTEPFTWASQGKDIQVSSLNSTQPFLRKKITFKNCIPVSVPQKNYNFAQEMGNDETMTEVKFSYDWYEISIFDDSGIEIKNN